MTTYEMTPVPKPPHVHRGKYASVWEQLDAQPGQWFEMPYIQSLYRRISARDGYTSTKQKDRMYIRRDEVEE